MVTAVPIVERANRNISASLVLPVVPHDAPTVDEVDSAAEVEHALDQQPFETKTL